MNTFRLKYLTFVAVLIVWATFLPGNRLLAQETTIAVVDLEGYGVPSNEVFALTNRLRNELFRMEKYIVLERHIMMTILEEQEFQMTGCVSESCLVEVGEMLGAQQMIGGSIAHVGSLYTLSLRLIDVKTGRVLDVIDVDHRGSFENLLTIVMRNIAEQIAYGKSEQPSTPVREPTASEELHIEPLVPKVKPITKKKALISIGYSHFPITVTGNNHMILDDSESWTDKIELYPNQDFYANVNHGIVLRVGEDFDYGGVHLEIQNYPVLSLPIINLINRTGFINALLAFKFDIYDYEIGKISFVPKLGFHRMVMQIAQVRAVGDTPQLDLRPRGGYYVFLDDDEKHNDRIWATNFGLLFQPVLEMTLGPPWTYIYLHVGWNKLLFPKYKLLVDTDSYWSEESPADLLMIASNEYVRAVDAITGMESIYNPEIRFGGLYISIGISFPDAL